MKQLLIIATLFVTCSAFGQGASNASTLLNSFASIDEINQSYPSTFDDFVKKLETKQLGTKRQDRFVEHLFAKTHQHYLKQYKAYAPISDLFTTGSYNCLTGTILYSILLTHFEIPHQVIETNYHIFILAQTTEGEVLLEATDPLNGFVSQANEIEDRIKTYRKNQLQPTASKSHNYHFSFELYKSVSLPELAGLLYYNKAVDSYNEQQIQQAVQFLEKAHALYSSVRIDEFSQILLLTLQQSAFDEALKTECLKKILSIRSDLVPVLAALN